MERLEAALGVDDAAAAMFDLAVAIGAPTDLPRSACRPTASTRQRTASSRRRPETSGHPSSPGSGRCWTTRSMDADRPVARGRRSRERIGQPARHAARRALRRPDRHRRVGRARRARSRPEPGVDAGVRRRPPADRTRRTCRFRGSRSGRQHVVPRRVHAAVRRQRAAPDVGVGADRRTRRRPRVVRTCALPTWC